MGLLASAEALHGVQAQEIRSDIKSMKWFLG